MKPPVWPRLLCKVSRAMNAMDVAQRIVRDELLFAFVQPGERDALTFQAYAQTRDYVEGGDSFSEGLFAWETALFEDVRIPSRGRVLLGAAGGGRELNALLGRGYDVYAFEPVETLLESARSVARGSNAVLARGTYRDLVARAKGESGPFDTLGGQIDLCILGWGSLSHLTQPNDVVETLGALRSMAPNAPVVASFILRSNFTPNTKGGARKLRRGLRRTLERLGGQVVPEGLNYDTAAGFFYAFSRDELAELCAQAGYDIAQLVEKPFAHVLLVPSAMSRTV